MGVPVFIYGPARSGTTLLRVLLGGHAHIAGLDELNYSMFLPMAFEKAVADAPALSPVDGFSLEHIRRALQTAHRAPRDAIAAAAGKTRWVDSTHSANDRYIATIDELYDGQCRYLLTRRHPGDVLASAFERWPGYDVLGAVTRLAAFAAAQQQIEAQLPDRAHRIAYEDLVQDPDRVIREALRFLGETADGYSAAEAMRAGGKAVAVGDNKIRNRPRVDTTSIGRWRSRLPSSVVRRIVGHPDFTTCLET
ncbi:MAG: sulfotransferase, partial [Myxococcota bacterium]